MESESLAFDVVIVGAGPAGLAAAIRLAQLSQQDAQPLSICVIDKGATVGANILSGAIIEPTALNELLPDWRTLGAPLNVTVTQEQFLLLTRKHAFALPTPPQLKNHGNYITSLENVCRFLSEHAQRLGVAIFPGFAGVEVLYESDRVCGILTGDKGVNKKGEHTNRFQPGIKLLAKQTLFAEGCHGSLTKQLIKKFSLQKNSPQTYGMGIKEVWEISEDNYQPGTVIHSVGWPLDYKTYGGGFIYHGDAKQLLVGLIVGLDYENPYLDPFAEMQRFKTHPKLRYLFKDGRRICYGARALCEGGLQSLPQLTVPGGMIIGDSAGFLNVPKIKGSHNAMKSGMIAAEVIYNEKSNLERQLYEFETKIRESWVWKELYRARNIRPAFRKGLWAGLTYAAIDTYLFRGKAPWTFRNYRDNLTLKKADQCTRINYPKPDNIITFDKLSSVYLSNTHYNEDQPCHLQILNPKIPIDVNLKEYDSPETRYCPANVYEIIYTNEQPRLQINATNCIQCKTCDIKDPMQNINWVPPEGGDGPNYIDM